jgi:lipoprotein-anchoring transpeptidase ErfK/SrfK
MKLGRLAAAAFAACLMLPASGLAAQETAPAWTDTQPATIQVTGGATVLVTLTAAAAQTSDSVHISALSLPRFVTFSTSDGNPATATLSIAAQASRHGTFVVALEARDSAGDVTNRVLTVVVTPDTRPVPLAGPGAISRWAYVLARTTARAAPRYSAKTVGIVPTSTPTGGPNLVRALTEQRDEQGREWVDVALATLPNGTTGWIPRSALDTFQVVRTHLVIDRAALSATLYRNTKEIFHATIGVGRPSAPTPAGEFYVREELRNFGDPFYGPVAFGTNARSAVLTDWPGGGFIGIHGTNEPQLLPGHISHGCIRMRNVDILRLAKLMSLGTPVTIR